MEIFGTMPTLEPSVTLVLYSTAHSDNGTSDIYRSYLKSTGARKDYTLCNIDIISQSINWRIYC
jgi:hypothetical protein